METVNTPVGYVPQDLYDEIKKVAGFKKYQQDVSIDPRYFDYIIFTQKHKARMINPNSERRSNEKNMIDMVQWLPVRYYNYMIALGLWNGNHKKALGFCRDKFFDNDGIEKFLPEVLAIKHLDDMEYISYTKLMNLANGAMHGAEKRNDLWQVWRGETAPRMIGKKKLKKQSQLPV